MNRLTPYLSESSGFTLIEVLVAMATGLVIVSAIVILIDITMDQTTRVLDTVTSEQQARSSMEQIVQELNSGCVDSDVSPVQASTATGISPSVNSDATHLVFVSGVGSGSGFTYTTTTGTTVTTLYEHVIALNSAGALVDTSYVATNPTTGSSGTLAGGPTWTFSSTPYTTETLAKHVASLSFAYYSYSNTANPKPNSLNGITTADELSTPLSSTWPSTTTNAAESVAEVDINLSVEPSSGWQQNVSRNTTESDSVIFRFTPPASSSVTNYPCD